MERKTIYVDDATGRQIASPEDARTGGATILRDADADRWLKANPDSALQKEEPAEPATKEQPRADNKARVKATTKGEEPDS